MLGLFLIKLPLALASGQQIESPALAKKRKGVFFN
jgi:hypothetical protein